MTDPIRGVLGPGEPAAIQPAGGTRTGPAATDGGTPGAAAAPSDSANVSQTQSLLRTIDATVASVPTVDHDQVTALRNAIATGTYQVNPRQVATQLLASDQALAAPGAGE